MYYSWDGYLNGSTKFNINVTVNGAVSTLQLMNDTSPSLLLASGKYTYCALLTVNNSPLVAQTSRLACLPASKI